MLRSLLSRLKHLVAGETSSSFRLVKAPIINEQPKYPKVAQDDSGYFFTIVFTEFQNYPSYPRGGGGTWG